MALDLGALQPRTFLLYEELMEGAKLKAKNLKATMVFIDFKKAFDSVHRSLLMKILRAYGIPEAIVRLIDGIYTGTKAKVVTADGITEILDILAGVLQRDTLAPYLFIIVIDYIMTVTIDDDDNTRTLKPSWLNAYFWNISFKNMLHSD